MKLLEWDVLRCDDGSFKSVNASHGLRSHPDHRIPNWERLTADEAASIGIQSAHADADDPKAAAPNLKPRNQPVSAIVAIQPETSLWIFPKGCEHLEDKFLVRLKVGDVLLFLGSVHHAGAGYVMVHYRLHSYIDPLVRPAFLSLYELLSL